MTKCNMYILNCSECGKQWTELKNLKGIYVCPRCLITQEKSAKIEDNNFVYLDPNSPLSKQEGGGHYKGMVIQPVEYITKNYIPFIEGSVIKYVSRHRNKNGKEDIKKAIHFLELLLELEYPEKGSETKETKEEYY